MHADRVACGAGARQRCSPTHLSLWVVSCLGVLAASSALASAPQSFSNNSQITIPALGVASPYSSNISVSGVSAFTHHEVSLNGFSHAFTDDVDVLLVGPQGQRAILMSDTGGSDAVSNLTLTFSQSAGAPIPDATAPSTGTFRPANHDAGIADDFPAPGPGTVTDEPADLAAFTGSDPNGLWNLFVVDDASGDAGSIANGWTLTFTVPQVFTVTKTADSNDGACDADCSLREAITAAQDGDLINFSTLFNTPRTIDLLTALPDVNRSISVQGPGANLLTVRRDFNATAAFRIFNIPGGVDNGVSLSAITIAGGRSQDSDAGGIVSFSDLRLTNVHVTGNQGGNGGGINFAYANGVFANCTISNNQATFQGGGLQFVGDGGHTLRLINSTVSGNRSGNLAGGIEHVGFSGSSRLEITNSTIANNFAPNVIGGIETFAIGAGSTATTTLRNTIVSGNSPNNLAAGSSSGGAATFQTLGFNLSNDSFAGGGFAPLGSDVNSPTPRLAPLALYGGQTPTHALLHASPAINAGNASGQASDQRGVARVFGGAADIGAVEMRPLVVTSTANGGAGSLRNALGSGGNAILTDIQFDNGVFGAPQTIALTSGQLGVFFDANLLGPGANLLTISGNNSSRVFEVPATITATLSGMTITGGSADGDGGGVFNAGTLTVTHSAIANNAAPFNGGGIGNDTLGILSVDHSTLSGNTIAGVSSGSGGGIHSRGVLGVSNSTVSGNAVTGSDSIAVGGIYSEGLATITHCTIADNLSPAGTTSGVLGFAGTVAIRNSIIASSVDDANQADVRGNPGAVSSLGFNLIGNRGTETAFNLPTDQSGTGATPLDPRLGPLQDNGGSTPTHALLEASPALDKGDRSGAVFDQRGSTRPVDLPGINNLSDGADIGAFESLTDPSGLIFRNGFEG